MSLTLPLKYLSIDLFRTLIFPKEHIATSYTDFGKRRLHFEFECAKVAKAFRNAFSIVNIKWPNFGCQHNVSSNIWWNEVIIQTFLQSSPFPESFLRNDLTVDRTNEMYDWFSTDQAWELEKTALSGLDKIASEGIDMCILSNSDERTPTLVKSLKLDNYFKFVCFSASCFHVKPEREIFQIVSKRFLSLSNTNQALNIAMKHYAHAGDSITKDYWGAVNAGCGAAFLSMHSRSETLPKVASDTPHDNHSNSNLSIEWAYSDAETSSVPAEDTVTSVLELARKLKAHNEHSSDI